MNAFSLATFSWWSYVASAAYLMTLVGMFAWMMAVATRESRLRAREARLEDFDTLSTSPL